MTELTRQLCAECALAHRFTVIAGGESGECPSCRLQADGVQVYTDPWAWKYVKLPGGDLGRVIGADYRRFTKATEYLVAVGHTKWKLGLDRCRTEIGSQLVELKGKKITPELVRTCHEIETVKRERFANLLLFPPETKGT